jgi:hypothetical protein
MVFAMPPTRSKAIEPGFPVKESQIKILDEVFGWIWLLPPQAVELLPTPTSLLPSFA